MWPFLAFQSDCLLVLKWMVAISSRTFRCLGDVELGSWEREWRGRDVDAQVLQDGELNPGIGSRPQWCLSRTRKAVVALELIIVKPIAEELGDGPLAYLVILSDGLLLSATRWGLSAGACWWGTR